MDKAAYLSILLSGQLILLVLDLTERFHIRVAKPGISPLKIRSALFVCMVILVYGALQFGGLALVPNFEELVVASQSLIREWLSTTGSHATISGTAVFGFALLGFYFAGLCDYLFHRFVSHSRAAWVTHEYHHLPIDISVYMPGFCVRPFLVVSVFPTSAIAIFTVQAAISLSGYSEWDMMPLVYAVVLAQTAIGSMSHSAYLRRLSWIHTLFRPFGLLSPQEHWLHHASDLEGNYGNFVTVWDRVFGTYLDPEKIDRENHRAGLAYDQDFLGALTLGKIKLSQRIRDAFQLEHFCFLNRSTTNCNVNSGNPATN
jgi:sterol desaturase/sphingolipid hydroxylase (fatty acid hydroxylase superfamily)